MLNDFIDKYGVFVGLIGMVLALAYTFAYRDRYKTLVNDIYIPGNDELRKQILDRDREIATLEKDNAVLQTALDEKEAASRQIQKLIPNLTLLTKGITELSSQTNQNHKEIMLALTDKIDGKQRTKST